MMEISSFDCGEDFTHIGCILEMCSLILCVHGVCVCVGAGATVRAWRSENKLAEPFSPSTFK